MSHLRHVLFLLLTCVLFNASAGARDYISLQAGEKKLVTLSKNITNVSISNKNAVRVIKHSDYSASIVGKRAGSARVKLAHGRAIIGDYDVSVSGTVSPVFGSSQSQVNELFPRENITIEEHGGTTSVSGIVSSPEVAAKIMDIVRAQAGNNALNLMKLGTSQQVMLHVRIGELSRDALDRYGLGLQNIIGLSPAILGALQKDKSFKILAEPNLTALSGEQAEFLAGGEFPIPVTQDGKTASVIFKPFGVNIAFTPNIISENRIHLQIATEISEISKTGGIKSHGIKIPSIITRRAKTSVEAAPGESFMIAGLVQDNFHSSLYEVPAVSEIPVLGALFRSTDFKNNASELVIAVTPYLVNPVKAGDIRLPSDDITPSSMPNRVLIGKKNYHKEAGTSKPAGFVLD